MCFLSGLCTANNWAYHSFFPGSVPVCLSFKDIAGKFLLIFTA